MAEAAKSLKEMWVLGTRQMVSERRGKTARFLAQLKDQSSDYAKAHHAVIAECDKMLSANEMAEMLLYCVNYGHYGLSEKTRDIAETLLKKAGVL